jgi:hypothetical protein
MLTSLTKQTPNPSKCTRPPSNLRHLHNPFLLRSRIISFSWLNPLHTHKTREDFVSKQWEVRLRNPYLVPLKTPLPTLSRLCLLFPLPLSLTQTERPLQRYLPPHSNQSQPLPSTNCHKMRGGEGQLFSPQTTKKRGKQRSFRWPHRTKLTTPFSFLFKQVIPMLICFCILLFFYRLWLRTDNF